MFYGVESNNLSLEPVLALQVIDQLDISLLCVCCADTLVGDLLPGIPLRFLLHQLSDMPTFTGGHAPLHALRIEDADTPSARTCPEPWTLRWVDLGSLA